MDGGELPEGYVVHEAFAQKEGLKGIWISKYEPSYIETAPTDYSEPESPDLKNFVAENTKLIYYTIDGKENIEVDYSENPSQEIEQNGKTYYFYNYTNKIWANVKTTANGLDSYWVWIPRFAYKAESGTVRMQIIPNATAWTNINVSEAYEECESLNSSTSTLGTSLLNAHLVTDADWSAMAIFSVSQYGGATTNTPEWTNGNKSGIYKVGEHAIYTTGILETANKNSTDYLYGLFNEDGTVKKYVKQWPADLSSSGFVGFTSTKNWLNSSWETRRLLSCGQPLWAFWGLLI